MKYIRTKDRENGLPIILKSEHYYHNELCYCGAEKSADTIKELCDGYIIIPNTKYGIPFTRRIDDFDFLHPLDKDITEAIYGFIKTDRGLIYVAKMNDKGELCLL